MIMIYYIRTTSIQSINGPFWEEWELWSTGVDDVYG